MNVELGALHVFITVSGNSNNGGNFLTLGISKYSHIYKSPFLSALTPTYLFDFHIDTVSKQNSSRAQIVFQHCRYDYF